MSLQSSIRAVLPIVVFIAASLASWEGFLHVHVSPHADGAMEVRFGDDAGLDSTPAR